VLVDVVGAVVVDSVLVSVLVLLLVVVEVGSAVLVVARVLERLDVVELLPPPLPAITTTATISPTMIASSAATR
jgi:hypothetical protein